MTQAITVAILYDTDLLLAGGGVRIHVHWKPHYSRYGESMNICDPIEHLGWEWGLNSCLWVGNPAIAINGSGFKR